MTGQAPDLISAVSAKPSLFFHDGGALVGYYLQGSLLLIWAAIGVYLAGTLLSQLLQGEPEGVEERDRHRGPGTPLLPYGPVRQLPVTGGTSSSILLLIYVFLGLAMVFSLVGTLYTRLRSRPAVPTTATSGPSMPPGESRGHQDDEQDAPEEHQE